MTATAVNAEILTPRKADMSAREPPAGSTLGEAIKWWAQRRGMSLSALGKKAGLSRTVMSLVGRDLAGTRQLYKLEDALELPRGTLSKYDVTKVTPELREFLRRRPRLVSALQTMAVQDKSEDEILDLLGVAPVDDISFRDLDDEVEDRLRQAGYTLDDYAIEQNAAGETRAVFRVRGPKDSRPRAESLPVSTRYTKASIDEFVKTVTSRR